MKKQKEFKIGKTKIGGTNPCFIVAEIGINFDGSLEQAVKLIDVASAAKCNAVKFQLFKAKRMYVKDAGKYQIDSSRKKNIIEIVKSAELPHTWMTRLRNYSHSKKLAFFSSVFDEKNADTLEKSRTDAFKIASYEITHIPLIQYLAKKRKPLVISCGGARLNEVAEAVEVAQAEGKKEIILMHCIAKYDAPLNSLNLNVIKTLKLAFPDVLVGYSDHSSDPVIAPQAAVSLDAKVIEKHITFDRKLPGPDHFFALEPHELKLMVRTIRKTEELIKKGRKVKIDPCVLGSSKRITFSNEKYVRKFAYRGIFSVKSIRKGGKFSRYNIAVLRPGEKRNGIHPRFYRLLVKGYKSTRNIPEGVGLVWKDILTK